MSGSRQLLRREDLEGELAAVLRAQYAKVQGGQRTAAAAATFVVMVALVCGLTLVPSLQSFFRVRFAEITALMGIEVVANLVATTVYHRRGGESRAFLAAERVEAVIVAAVAVALVYRSGSAGSIFWSFYYLQMLTLIPLPRSLRFNVTVLVACTAGGALAFSVSQKWADALATVFLGGASVWVLATLGKGQLEQARTLAERNLLERALQELRLEHERERIARDLHDGVGAELTSLALRARSLRAATLDPAQQGSLDELVERARLNLEELRSVVFALKNPAPTWPQLVELLGRKVADLCRDGLAFEVRDELGPAAPPLPPEWGRELVPMIQEAVRNAVRHAEATHLLVRLARSGEHLLVDVVDDGVGIPRDAVERSASGLEHLRARAAALSAELAVEGAREGRGTAVRVRVPWSVDAAGS